MMTSTKYLERPKLVSFHGGCDGTFMRSLALTMTNTKETMKDTNMRKILHIQTGWGKQKE